MLKLRIGPAPYIQRESTHADAAAASAETNLRDISSNCMRSMKSRPFE